ncbi:hypothetical protein GLOIN_2v1488565 [Rhizophagus irregularis DAOM 181602=DAOM 197198]|nr:hypothetical protein GLOIN_2v1488565 [Rhizophagus irregularis DAOM 181602=DAOM 197198]
MPQTNRKKMELYLPKRDTTLFAVRHLFNRDFNDDISEVHSLDERFSKITLKKCISRKAMKFCRMILTFI